MSIRFMGSGGAMPRRADASLSSSTARGVLAAIAVPESPMVKAGASDGSVDDTATARRSRTHK